MIETPDGCHRAGVASAALPLAARETRLIFEKEENVDSTISFDVSSRRFGSREVGDTQWTLDFAHKERKTPGEWMFSRTDSLTAKLATKTVKHRREGS